MHLQVFYNESSQLFEYLKEHGMHDESMHYRGLQQSEGFDQQLHFIERQDEKEQESEQNSSHCQILSFQEFVYSIFWLKSQNIVCWKKAIIQLLYILLVDILEKAYLTYKLNSTKKKQQIHKLGVYFYLISFIVLLTIVFGSTFFLISLLCYFLLVFNCESSTKQQKMMSLCEEIEQILIKMMSKVKELKLKFVIQQLNIKLTNPKQALQRQNNLKNSLQKIQRIFSLQHSQKDKLLNLQDLYQFILQIKENISVKSYSNSFIQSSNIFYQKYLALRAYIDLMYLKNISQSIANLEYNINLVQQNPKQELLKSVSKPQKQMYIKLLIKCIQKEKINQITSQKLSIELKELVQLLRKEVQLQHLMNIAQILPEKKEKTIINLIEKEENNAQIAETTHIQTQSFYLSSQRDQKEEFIPPEKQKLKNSLNTLFQKKQKSTKQQVEGCLQSYEQQKPKKIPYQRQIHPFGFKIVLPKRDMDAYYVE